MRVILKLLFILFSLINSFVITKASAQQTYNCYGTLYSLSSWPCYETESVDTVWVCKGDTIRFKGTTQIFQPDENVLAINSAYLDSETLDKDGYCNIDGSATPLLQGGNIISQEVIRVERQADNCPLYWYFIKAVAIINESGLYTIEWERTYRKWNAVTESYDVERFKHKSSTYYKIKGGAAVPSFTLSKNKANVGESIIATPQINYTNPNAYVNILGLHYYDCKKLDTTTISQIYGSNLTTITFTQNTPKKIYVYARALDNGCLTQPSPSQAVTFGSCASFNIKISNVDITETVLSNTILKNGILNEEKSIALVA